MTLLFPEPTDHRSSQAEVLLGYLEYFRSVIVDKVDGLPDGELRASRLASGWTPLGLIKHLTHVERRWMVWGFAGEPVANPWADSRDGRWFVSEDEHPSALVEDLHRQGSRTREIVRALAAIDGSFGLLDGEELPSIAPTAPAVRISSGSAARDPRRLRRPDRSCARGRRGAAVARRRPAADRSTRHQRRDDRRDRRGHARREVRRLLDSLQAVALAWRAGEFRRTFHRSHGAIGITDYLIAATFTVA